MRKLKGAIPWIVGLLLVVGLVGTAVFSTLANLQRGVAKLKMPGTYEFDVSVGDYKGCYGVWYFSTWPSKGISQTPSRINLKIVDANNEPISTYDAEYTEPKQPISFLFNVGKEIGFITTKTSQRIQVSSPDECIIVFVPCSAYYRGFWGDRFWGAFDDMNFIPKKQSL